MAPSTVPRSSQMTAVNPGRPVLGHISYLHNLYLINTIMPVKKHKMRRNLNLLKAAEM